MVQKYFTRQIKKSGKPQKLNSTVRKLFNNVPIAGKDLLRAFYMFLYLRFYDSSDQ